MSDRIAARDYHHGDLNDRLMKRAGPTDVAVVTQLRRYR
jgi:hypothetical protein